MLTKINVGMCTSNEDGSVTINYSDGGSVTYVEKDGEMKTPTAFNWTPEMEAIWPREMRPTASGLLAIWEALHGAAVYADAPAPSPATDDGWIPHKAGDPCPVPARCYVEIKTRRGDVSREQAGGAYWGECGVFTITHWRHLP